VSFKTLLDKVSFGVRPGECVAILGPSGAGKSTLMKLINGHTRDGSGEVRYDGLELEAHYSELKARIGYVPQDDIVHPSLTPRSELTFAAQLRLPGVPSEKHEIRVREVLGQLELDKVADTRIRRLSGGQRKRVSLGVELLTSPPVLFLDEPTSGLDPALEQKMMALFQSLAKQGRAVLVTTHVMESLQALDLVLVMMTGQLIFFGPPQEVLAYFQVTSFPAIYAKLEGTSPTEWRNRYRSTPCFKKYVLERLKEPIAAPPEVTPSVHSSPQAPSTPEAPSAAPCEPPSSSVSPPPGESLPEKSSPASAVAPTPESDLDAELAALKREVQG
jgi:ABC-type multidrug transport system ATPase subunit